MSNGVKLDRLEMLASTFVLPAGGSGPNVCITIAEGYGVGIQG